MHDELARRGVALRILEARSSVRDILRVEGIEDKFGPIDRFQSLADVVEGFEPPAGVPKPGEPATKAERPPT